MRKLRHKKNESWEPGGQTLMSPLMAAVGAGGEGGSSGRSQPNLAASPSQEAHVALSDGVCDL